MSSPIPNADRSAERRRQLVGIKLRTLVAEHLDVATGSLAEARPIGPGAALVHDGAAWVYLDDEPESGLGAALAWALRRGATDVNVLAERGTGTLARRAAEFDAPVDVWHVDDRSLLAAVVEPLLEVPPVPTRHEPFRRVIEAAGADARVEHGVLFGEVRGLEVCRVVDDAHTGATRLEVGVGAHDREAFQMLHGDEPTPAALARVVDVVARHRSSEAPGHPLNRLAGERFLRWRLLEQPDLVGAAELHPAEPPVPRTNLKDAVPCVASGTDPDGRPLLVVCSVGVDLDLVPYAADARLAAEPGVAGGRLVLALPARDRVRVTDDLAGLLRHPAEITPVG